MATAVVDDETEDLTTCNICLYSYDENIRKPKFLSCHHTFCLVCIKSIPRDKEGVFACPNCRKKTSCSVNQVSKLTNNPYALHMISALNNQNPTSTQTRLPKQNDRCWCLNCKKEARSSCRNDHSTFSMGSKSADFCAHLQKSLELNVAQLGSIMEKRDHTRSYLDQVSSALKLIGEGVRRLEEENGIRFAQIASLFESYSTINADETAQSLSLKLKETTDMIKDELTSRGNQNGRNEICNMLPFYEQKDVSNHQGRQKDEPNKMLKEATQVLLSFLKIVADHQADKPPAVVPKQTASTPVAIIPRGKPTSNISSDNNCVFAMTFFKSNNNFGTVLIKPSKFYGSLDRSFGRFTLSSPPFPLSGMCIEKATPNSFVTIPGIVDLLQALFPNPSATLLLSTYNTPETSDPLDVKLVDNSFDVDGTLADFHMVFLLNKLEQWNQRRKRSILFGKIVGGETVIDILSQTTHLDRNGFTIYVDYRIL